MDMIADLTERVKDGFPDGKIILLDGRVVNCYPRAMDEQDGTFDVMAVYLYLLQSNYTGIDSRPDETGNEADEHSPKRLDEMISFLMISLVHVLRSGQPHGFHIREQHPVMFMYMLLLLSHVSRVRLCVTP